VRGEQAQQPEQLAGQQQVAAGVVVKPPAEKVARGRGHGARRHAVEVPVQERRLRVGLRQAQEVRPVQAAAEQRSDLLGRAWS
jgi:hypothetical protein